MANCTGCFSSDLPLGLSVIGSLNSFVTLSVIKKACVVSGSTAKGYFLYLTSKFEIYLLVGPDDGNSFSDGKSEKL